VRRVIWNDPVTGIMTTVIPAFHDLGSRLPGETDDGFLARVIAKDVPSGVDTWVIDDDDPVIGPLINDRRFRDGCKVVGGVPVVDMERAKKIHRERIRQARDAELVKVSGSIDRLPPEIEALLKPDRIALLKALRDLPAKFDLEQHKTPDELDAAWPAILPER
jgi:hypothetical protein